MNNTAYGLSNISEDDLSGIVAGGTIGKEIFFLREVDSTNIYASKLAQDGMPEGVVVIADCQKKGKGRLNRVWQSPPGKNIYTSIILRPSITPHFAPQLTLTAGVAVAELISQYCPGSVMLKWPNDVQINMRKVCGILTEMRIKRGKIDFIIVGMGININMRKEDFQEEFRESSTSLQEETGNVISRIDFANKIYRTFGKWYETYIDKGFVPIRESWLGYSGILNKNISVHYKNEVHQGRVIGIDEYGALLLFDEENETKRILAGDVSLIGEQ
ncbi:MAG: biotin--[acetyl-CoA-carboxylase] ligase [Deltaproteobacteria bacterium]|nr:biotin--[acetyl-CoA-carboxylase] ligase [Deltaproteobacteria bacterium]